MTRARRLSVFGRAYHLSMVELSVLRGDITALAVGAIVNAANSSLMGGGGVDGAIHRAGGPAILADCKAIVAARGECEPGQAVVTGAGDLQAGIVIHTVGPIWTEEDASDHDATLASCYRACLDLAAEHNIESVAFPNISTGVYRFPKPRAAGVAINAVIDWLEVTGDHSLKVITFVCHDKENHDLYTALVG